MTTMLEKMAEAMWSVKLAADAVPGVEVPATEPLWLGLPDLERTRWRYRARAALQAIREPTEAGARSMRLGVFSAPPPCSDDIARFTAMIDAILNEPDSPT